MGKYTNESEAGCKRAEQYLREARHSPGVPNDANLKVLADRASANSYGGADYGTVHKKFIGEQRAPDKGGHKFPSLPAGAASGANRKEQFEYYKGKK